MTPLAKGFNRARQPGILCILLFSALLMTGCSSVQTVQFKINSEPEGAHVVIQVSSPDAPGSGDWIYMGNTPIRGVRQLDEDETADATITLKVMHTGYYDQVRKWDGESFWDEAVERGFIFWTPELVPQPAER